MTRPDAQAPPQPAPSATEVEYVRKLSLAILSTLQAKGLLSADEVDAILIAARRAAQGVLAVPASVPAAPATLPSGVAPAMQVTVQPAPSLTFHAHARAPQAEPETRGGAAQVTADDAAPAVTPEAEADRLTDGPGSHVEAQAAEPLTVEAPSQPIALGPDVVEDPAVPSAPLGAEAQDVPPASEDESVTKDAPTAELDIEPPAQTIVIGPDEVEEETAPEPVTAAADDLVLDGAAPAKPAEEPKPAVPAFDLKLD
ncbi:hypothetical protein L1280_000229 [Deinococcus sp. HSC-46F16]|uniref:hypothetical protein n=1 Tax=Deinococcus sp. HSC-46F16 TaxID=2910968 RepID=UPI00209D9902|nr:hypothetical protein [Deinococcus sp. HSC-46F16]MCP2013101.1 hypothetical protein [Deinococcus sp. HSC-46F16]